MPSVEAFFEHSNALTSGKNPLQILRETRALLEDEHRWTKEARALDAWGNHVRAEDPNAVAWCLEGAVARVSNPFGITPVYMLKLLDKVVSVVFHTEEEITAAEYEGLMHHGAILQLLDDAILIEELKWNGTAS